MAETGTWFFIAGLLISVIFGFVNGTASAISLIVLVILGVIVGILNISEKEAHRFLIASLALLLASSINIQTIPVLGIPLQNTLNNVVLFIAPAALVVAVKEVFYLASKR
jgi:membrane-associated HD superfamily phosphohydrolase